jgi:glycosyltransferase involved in cell wall biosynthesis
VIDVLLPFYGDPDLLYLAVDSVLEQTHRDLRLVIVDDGYPDPAVASWFAAHTDARLEYHRNETNLGANANYTRALELATAEHVVVMGADDVMLPNYLSTVISALGRFPQAAVVQCGVQVIDGEGQLVTPLVDRVKTRVRPTVDEPTLLGGQPLLVSLLRGNWTYFPSLCWRTDAVRAIGFRPEFHVVQDMALLVDVILDGGELALVPEVAFHYRRHQGSDSAVKTLTGSRFHEEKSYFELIESELDRRGFSQAARAARWHTTSRLHAAALVPTAVRGRDSAALARLVRHALR